MRIVIFLGLICLSACTLHPKYSRPEMSMPTSWRIPTIEASDTSNICWWKQFNDPVLDEYIDEALANNQDLLTAVYRVDEFVAKLGIARSYLYPQLNGTVAGARERISTTLEPIQPGIDPISNSYSLLLNASYQADIWGKFRSATEVAMANLLSEIQARRTVVLTLVSSVASTYIQICELDMELGIAKETIDIREISYNLAQTRYELGLSSELEVEQSLSELQSARIEYDRIQIGIALHEDLLCVLLGKPPGDVKRGRLLSEICLPPSVPVAIPSEIVNQRPDVLAAEQNLIAANAQIGVAKAEFFPQISLTGSYGSETSVLHTIFNKPSNVWEYGANLLQEIFTGGRLTSQLKLTRAQKISLLHQYESTILTALQEVNDALISHRITLDITKQQKERVDALSLYYQLAVLRYNDGLNDYLTVVDAESRLFSAQLEYAQSQANNFLTLIDIYKTLGGGWVVEADDYSEKTIVKESD